MLSSFSSFFFSRWTFIWADNPDIPLALNPQTGQVLFSLSSQIFILFTTTSYFHTAWMLWAKLVKITSLIFSFCYANWLCYAISPFWNANCHAIFLTPKILSTSSRTKSCCFPLILEFFLTVFTSHLASNWVFLIFWGSDNKLFQKTSRAGATLKNLLHLSYFKATFYYFCLIFKLNYSIE